MKWHQVLFYLTCFSAVAAAEPVRRLSPRYLEISKPNINGVYSDTELDKKFPGLNDLLKSPGWNEQEKNHDTPACPRVPKISRRQDSTDDDNSDKEGKETTTVTGIEAGSADVWFTDWDFQGAFDRFVEIKTRILPSITNTQKKKYHYPHKLQGRENFPFPDWVQSENVEILEFPVLKRGQNPYDGDRRISGPPGPMRLIIARPQGGTWTPIAVTVHASSSDNSLTFCEEATNAVVQVVHAAPENKTTHDAASEDGAAIAQLGPNAGEGGASFGWGH
ncbi:hypothetical protein ETB97_005948 [Aspergillus alliaceus]|uniref:Uncharacterized protein n=1 Tax=Petromyces alliaceus TaxID=209559 RepID=A0A8H5ZUZ3_PETAA|nr:hypothetical protein ETB97_005948 [Aspergillus burnettii]